MSESPNRAEVFAALGLKKAPELVTIKGGVQQEIAETLRELAGEAGVKEEEIVGLAVTDWVKRAKRRLAKANA